MSEEMIRYGTYKGPILAAQQAVGYLDSNFDGECEFCNTVIRVGDEEYGIMILYRPKERVNNFALRIRGPEQGTKKLVRDLEVVLQVETQEYQSGDDKLILRSWERLTLS